jgi:excisionase family DNA binding protein
MTHYKVPHLKIEERIVLTVGETAALLRSCPSTIYALLSRGALHSVKIGGRRLICRDSIDALLGINEQDATVHHNPGPVR